MDAREDNQADRFSLVRLTSWATAAALAMTVAGLATVSSTGSQRLGVAVAALTGGEAPQAATQVAIRDVENERRRLNDSIRLLASDRDRLLTRVTSLERNLDDITGSITRQASTARPPMPDSGSPQAGTVSAAPEQAPPVTLEAAPRPAPQMPPWLENPPESWPHPSVAIQIAPAPAPPSRMAAVNTDAPPPPAATRTEFGVDIGSGSTLEEVRALWSAARAQHGRLLGNLRPIVVNREDRNGDIDMRLVVGPLANAAAAARLCASLGAADVMCSTRPYQGERLPP